jgi:hypothetical protein
VVRLRDLLKMRRAGKGSYVNGLVKNRAGVRVKAVVRFHGLVKNGGGGTGMAVVT